MNPRLISNTRLAIAQLRANRGRTFFTMLGIIVGVAAVIVIVAIGEGVKQQVARENAYLGKDVIAVQPRQDGTLLQSSTSTLTEPDRAAVATLSQVEHVTPLARLSGTVSTDATRDGRATVIATGSDAGTYFGDLVAYGSFFSKDDSNDATAVIGESVAARLFKEEVPLGKTLTFRGQQFIVQGVLDQFSNTPLSTVSSYNDTIFIPYDTATKLADSAPPAYQILAKATNGTTPEAAAAAIDKAILANHGGQRDFTLNVPGQATASGSTTLDALTLAITGTAALSLIVAGIGVMNVMLVSVTERTHEIGIRKAVGATNRQIFNQFAIEALVLSIEGGLLGIALAYAIDGLLRLLTDLRPIISWQAVVVAFGVTAAIGFIFGSVPAIKAARKDPIDALRNS